MDHTIAKSPFQSLTINASLLAFIVSLLELFGITIEPETVPHLANAITGICALLAIYGRYRARKIIAPTSPT